MKKILAIGNSFSQDATAYLHQIAEADGRASKIVNLYIGGCSLQTHCENLRTDTSLYAYELNGQSTGRMVSIREALCEDTWDYVTMQQASHDSGLPDTYEPYIYVLSESIRQYAPGAEQLLHETWAYEIDSDHGAFPRYSSSQETMYAALSGCYRAACAALELRMIPCGDVIQEIRRTEPLFDYAAGGQSLCRDGFHMHLIYGRYLTAAVWYRLLFDGDLSSNSFLPAADGDPLFSEKIAVLKKHLAQIVRSEK